jgi:hypothetical protein
MKKKLEKFLNLSLVCILTSFGVVSHAEILFEGYYKIEIEGKHIGYSIIREEFDPVKKLFTSTRFTKTTPDVGDITMSAVAVSDDAFKPKELQFVYLDKSKKQKVIKGKVVGDKFNLDVTDGGPMKKETVNLPKGVFFSCFTTYLMMQKGIKTDTRFTYPAIAEETGSVENGETYVEKNMMDYKGQKVFRAVNKFAGASFVALLTNTGETLVSDTPAQNEHAELVKTADEATRGIPVPKSVIETLYGNMPTGTKNSLNPDAPAPTPTPKAAPKANVKKTEKLPAKTGQKLEVPPGRGIIIKSQTKELGK